jgi:8-oxo-dGTP pyrophosphatase MutT (NUDIX family)
MSEGYLLPLTRSEEAGKRLPHIVRAAVRIAVVGQWPDGCKCLFVHHPSKGLELPGGAIEPDEKPSQAGLRELTEEAGIQFHIAHPLILITMLPVKDHRGGSWLDIIYGTLIMPRHIRVHEGAELPISWLMAEEIEERVDRQLSSYKAALTALTECMNWNSQEKS